MGVLVFDSAIFSLTLYKAFTMGRRCVLFDTISLLGLIILRRDYVPFVLLFILSGFDG